MLLCNIDDVNPGMTLGAAVLHPGAPWVELLKPGVTLDRSLLASLGQRGVTQVWVNHDITSDLDNAVAAHALAVKTQVYQHLRDNFSNLSKNTIGAVEIQRYRQVIMDLVVELVAAGKFASLTDQLFSCQSTLFSHGSNVAYLSVLVGIELQDYIVRERRRLDAQHARDLTPLGLGAMLHDVGKAASGELDVHHEVCGEAGDSAAEEPEHYKDHVLLGRKMLTECRAPASATQIVLNHHQRFDGTGWPAMSRVTGRADQGPQSGRDIHVFSRIVGAANVLDNLLTGAEQTRRPPIAALCEFAGPRFDSWFDPVVRRAMLRSVPPFAVGSKVTLSDGRDAVVTAPNVKQPCRPAVRMLDGSPVTSKPLGEPSGAATERLPEDLRIVEWIGINVERWLFDVPNDARPAVNAAAA